MSVEKRCADFLRSCFVASCGQRICAGHAHELIAAYFGYKSSAELAADRKYPLSDLHLAAIIIPDLSLMDKCCGQLTGLPVIRPSTDVLAKKLDMLLHEYVCPRSHIWHTRNLPGYLNAEYIQNDPLMIKGGPSGAPSLLHIEEINIEQDNDCLIANVSGHHGGQQNRNKPVCGDSIAFTTLMTFHRVAGRSAFELPRLETSRAADR